MDVYIQKFYSFLNSVKGFLEYISAQTPRYCFIIEKINLIYCDTYIKAKIDYTPVGCYRPFRNFASDLNDKMICRKFKPDHARIIIGIDTLEKTLDFKKQEQIQLYLDFVQSCVTHLRQ